MPIHYEPHEDHIVLVTIDRPPRNALDLYHFRDLAAAWRRFRDDHDARVAVITGTGESFHAGADLKTYIPQVAELQAKIASGEVREIDGCRVSDSMVAALRRVKIYKPIVAAVNGHCVAGGMEMLGGIDIRIACPEATFGLLEPKHGLVASGGSTVRLPRQIAFPHAMELLLRARRVPASRALAMGILNEVVPRDELLETALCYARDIASNAPIAVQATKESVMRGLELDLDAAFALEQEIGEYVIQTEDAKEGPRAFAEKRAPRWQGR